MTQGAQSAHPPNTTPYDDRGQTRGGVAESGAERGERGRGGRGRGRLVDARGSVAAMKETTTVNKLSGAGLAARRNISSTGG